MATSSQFFTPQNKKEMYNLGEQLGMAYEKLYTEAYKAGRKLWKLTPKVHLAQELLQFQCQVWGNPS